MSVSLEVTRNERSLIGLIVARFAQLSKKYDAELTSGDKLSLAMDLTACHANGCPLKLGELFNADHSNFIHDVAGIRNTLDRATGKLTNHFLPKFHKAQVEA